MSGERLQRAITVFAAWEDSGRAEASAAILARHADIADLLEPMFDESASADEDSISPARRSELPPQLGPYRLIRELGRGGMGVVYEAEQVELARRVVVKVLPHQHTDDALARARFRREAWAAAKLRHPNIVRVFDVGEVDGQSFLAMEFVDGAPLDQVLSRCKRDDRRDGQTIARAVLAAQLRPSNAPDIDDSAAVLESPTWQRSWRDVMLGIATGVADALEHAHESGVVHRDVKPSNILIRTDGMPVLVDFGLARDEMLPSVTVVGAFAGTPHYVSPEQAAAGQVPVDRRTDVFSLGTTLFEMLTLELPFEGETHHQVLEHILAHEARDLRALDPTASADLRAILGRALERSVERRYESAAMFASDLRAILAGHSVSARPITRLQRTWRWARREPWLAGSIAAAVLATLIGAAVSLGFANVAATRLSDIERLADSKRLQQLQSESARLWPAVPSRVTDMRAWLASAESVIARLALHRRTLDDLRRQARALSPTEIETLRADLPEGRELAWLRERIARQNPEQVAKEELARRTQLEATIADTRFWRFADEETQWQHDLLAQLVDDIAAFAQSGGAVEDMRRRLDEAKTIGGRSTERFADEWRSAIEEIAASPVYGGIRLRPMLGLVPVGTDPETKLWEFADVRTGVVPRRDADGKLSLEVDSALVLVLLPGARTRLGASADETRGKAMRRFDPLSRGNEQPIHDVELAPFLIGKFEVTRGQWIAVHGANAPAIAGDHPANLPMAHVSWTLADAFVRRLGCHLPTEAQWEYAARGGTDEPWWTGETIESLDGRANLADRSAADLNPAWVQHPKFDDGFAHWAPVGSFAANGYGLHDTAGNVWEWCLDLATMHYRDPVRAETGERLSRAMARRALRGGAFTSGADKLRSAYRSGDFPDNQAVDTGLRVALLASLQVD